MIRGSVAVIGAGRVGLTLARALSLAGVSVRVLVREPRALPAGLPAAETAWAPALAEVELVLLAVPDDALLGLATELASLGTITARQVVLHCSGLRDRDALAALAGTGAALGSLHPLQTFALPEGDPAALRGTPAIVEGTPVAVAAARELAGILGMSPVLELPTGTKARYHAGAVFASNFVVTLAALAERLAREAGAGDQAAHLFQPLLAATVEHLRRDAPAVVLTGPIRRGDVGTVRAHLRALTGADRTLYIALARETLRVARDGGLDEGAAREIERALDAAGRS